MGLIGDTLFETRRKLNKTLKDAEKATKIRVKYLEALEKENFEVLPEDVFVIGFIRSYCRFLEVDPAPLIREFKARSTSYKIEIPAKPPETKEEKFTRRFAPPRKIYIVVAIIILIIIGAIAVNALRKSSPTIDQELLLSEEPTEVAKETPEITVPPEIFPETTVTAEETQTAKFTLNIKVVERCWLRVKVDGNLSFEGTLNPGDEKEWEADESVYLFAGNPPGLEIKLNDTLIIPFARGTFEATITAE